MKTEEQAQQEQASGSLAIPAETLDTLIEYISTSKVGSLLIKEIQEKAMHLTVNDVNAINEARSLRSEEVKNPEEVKEPKEVKKKEK